MTSILDILDMVRPRLPDWVSQAGFRRVRAAAALLPKGSPVCFLECGLAKRSSRLDFGLCYPHPAHRSLLNGNQLLARRVPFIWLEVDQARVDLHSPPGILLCVDDKLGREAFGRTVPELTEKRMLALGDAAHRQFLLDELPRAVRDSLRTCFAALPANGRILHLCFMPSRKPPVMKLNVSLPKRALISYLKRVGWPGSLSTLARVWEQIGPPLQTAKIDLTLSPSLRPKLGLEVHPFNTSFEGRREVLAWLRREGKVDARQCADLAAWHGAKGARSAGKPSSFELDFGMKIVLDQESQLEAKGYFQIASEALILPATVSRARRKFDV